MGLSWIGFISLGVAFCQGVEVPKRLTMPSGGPGTATNLAATADYDPAQGTNATVKLQWVCAVPPGLEQRMVITIFKDGFERGAFDVSGPLRSNQTSLVWDKAKGQAIHHWKVLTLQPTGWVASATATFEGPLLIRDRVNKSPKPPNLKTNNPQKESPQ